MSYSYIPFLLSVIRLKDQREVAADKRHEMVYEEFVASLVIKDVQDKDAGSYTCEASNDLGTVNTSGLLEIQGMQIFILITGHYIFNGS